MRNFLKRRGAVLLKATLLALLALTLYIPSSGEHYANAYRFHNGDSFMHLPPYLRDIPDPVRDYPERYIRACHPTGFRALYTLAAAHGQTRALSRVLPYILTTLFVGFVALAVWPLGGWPVATVAVLLALSSDVFLNRMVGGLPRAFGFPFLAASLAALTHRRPVALAATTVLATLFYPSAAVIGGLSLAAGLLIPRLKVFPSTSAQPWRHRLILIIATAALCGAGLLPTLLATRPYGPQLAPRDIKHYPEAGIAGRCGPEDRVDYAASLPDVLRTHVPLALKNEGAAWIPSLRPLVEGRHNQPAILIPALVLMGLGLLWLLTRVPAGRGVGLYLAITLFCYFTSQGVSPWLFLPERYVSYSVPLFTLVLLPAGCAALGHWLWPWQRQRAAAITAFIGGLLFLTLLGGRINPTVGYTLRFKHAPSYDYLADLPATALIGGAPDWLAPVSYLGNRPVFVSQETHLPYHRRYLDEMRRRMAAQIRALYSPHPADLVALNRRYGVTHLVVPHRVLQGDGLSGYFMPFTAWYLAAAADLKTRPPALLGFAPHHVVYTDRQLAVIDLTALAATVPLPAAAHGPAATDEGTPPAGTSADP